MKEVIGKETEALREKKKHKSGSVERRKYEWKGDKKKKKKKTNIIIKGKKKKPNWSGYHKQQQLEREGMRKNKEI